MYVKGIHIPPPGRVKDRPPLATPPLDAPQLPAATADVRLLFFVFFMKEKTDTVKLVYKDHPRDQQNVVLIRAWKAYTRGTVQCGLYKQVVFIYRWSLEEV